MHYNKHIGAFGESLARDFLEKRNYKIIDSNIKISYQEIDIVASKDNFLIFVEVKTRTSDRFGRADESMTENKLNSLQMAVERYLDINNINSENIRLDLISIDLDKVKKSANIKHYKGIV